jgi:uncharacterized protein
MSMFADRLNQWTDRLTVTIKPTWVCNLRCHYCYQGRALPVRRKGMMSEPVLDACIRTASRLPVETVDLQWIGGETLAPGVAFFRSALDLTERHAVEGGPRLVHWLQTNLTLIDEEWVAFLEENADRLVLSVSYDFFEDYFRLTQRNGDRAARHQWGRIQRALALLQRHDIEFGCLTTLDRNALAIPAAAWFEQWVAQDIRRVGLQFDYGDVFGFGDSRAMGEPWRPYIDFLDEIIALQAAHNPEHPDRPVLLRESLYLYNKLTGVRDDGWTGSCHHSASLCGQYFWTIDVDGSVYGMCDAFMAEDVAAEFRLGNVVDGDLRDLKNADAFAALTERQYDLKHSEICRDCSVYRYCKGGCPAFKSERNMLRSFSGDSVYCAYTRAFFGHLQDPARRQRIVAACQPLRPEFSSANG